MSYLEENLFSRAEVLFESELKKRLHDNYQNVVTSINLELGSDKFENLKNRLIAMQATIENLTDTLMKVGNNAITNFQNEVENVPSVERERSVDHLKDLIVQEIRELIKMASAKYQW